MTTQYVFGSFHEADLSPDDVLEVVKKARNRVSTLRKVPADDILELLDRMSRRWADPADRYRRQAQGGLPEQIGFSPAMVEKDLEGFVMALSRPFCEAKIRRELGSASCLDRWVRPAPGGAFVKAQPHGVVLHVAAGNVGSVGVLSLVEGLLAKNVGVLKAASAAPLFPRLFAESLLDTDEGEIISRCLAILQWSGRRAKHHKLFQQHADAIVVWGGEDAVKEYREGLGIQAALIEWGPKVSLAMVAREVDLGLAARNAARDVSMWDQNACSSAQLIYVEGQDRVAPFVAALESEMSAFATELPMGDLGLQEQAEITKTRQLAKIDVALGRAELHTPTGPDWTIVVEDDPAFKLSPLFRTVYVKPLADLRDAAPRLAPYAAYLQTVGLAAPTERLLALGDALCDAGVLRVTKLGAMSGGQPGEPHDGALALQRLVKWVSLDAAALADRFDPIDFLAPEAVADMQWNQLRAAYRRARRLSAFYAKRFPLPDLQTIVDWTGLPTLSKAEYRAHVPPGGRDLLCGEHVDGLTLRSGGSSGMPLVALISKDDYEADMAAGARGAFAAGLRPGDRVANLFFAGNLYGSFVSTNRILEILGCHSFPLTSQTATEDILEVLRTFDVNVVIGLPSHLQLIFSAMAEAPHKYHVRKVFYTGEHFYKKEQEYWRNKLGFERIASIGYGTVDAGPLAYQCPAAEGSVHHVLAGHQYLEILDRDTHEPLGPGEIGEIVVSTLHPRVMPLLRYRIGDLGRLVPGPCACGRAAPRVELLGRTDDIAVVGGYNLAYGSFQQIVERYTGLHSKPQLELCQPVHKDVLVIKVEREEEDTPAEQLAAQLREVLVTEIPELKKALASGMLEAVAVQVLQTGGLERYSRTGKIVHVIDRRRRTGQLV